MKKSLRHPDGHYSGSLPSLCIKSNGSCSNEVLFPPRDEQQHRFGVFPFVELFEEATRGPERLALAQHPFFHTYA